MIEFSTFMTVILSSADYCVLCVKFNLNETEHDIHFHFHIYLYHFLFYGFRNVTTPYNQKEVSNAFLKRKYLKRYIQCLKD